MFKQGRGLERVAPCTSEAVPLSELVAVIGDGVPGEGLWQAQYDGQKKRWKPMIMPPRRI